MSSASSSKTDTCMFVAAAMDMLRQGVVNVSAKSQIRYVGDGMVSRSFSNKVNLRRNIGKRRIDKS